MSENNSLTRAKHKQAGEAVQCKHLQKAKKLYQQMCEKDRSMSMLG